MRAARRRFAAFFHGVCQQVLVPTPDEFTKMFLDFRREV